MDSYLKPERFDISPDSNTASQQWKHWYKTFQNFITQKQTTDSEKLKLLVNFVSATIFEHISECGTYNDAVNILKNIYVKPTNEIFARHKLRNRRQEAGETVDKYIEGLKLLSKDCNFRAVTAETYSDESIRDAFISGLSAPYIRQRLLEKSPLSLQEAYELARSLELAVLQSKEFVKCSSGISSDNPSLNLVSLEEN